jgi:Zn-finger domain-containing protein
MESSELIRISNEFLDNLKRMKFEIEELLKKKLEVSVVEEYAEKLKENLRILEELKEKMELLGFDTPYINIGKLKGFDSDELYEIMNYTSYLRRMANEKKGVLERIRHSVVSHKIALGHLLEDIGNKKIIQYLPYDGSYKAPITGLSPYLINAYKEILNILQSQGKGVVTSVTLSLIVFKDGKREFKRIKIDDENYEDYIKKHYKDAIITSMKRNYSKNKLIDDQYVRRVLAVGYLNAYKDDVERGIEKKLDELLTDEQKKMLETYKRIVSAEEEEDYEGGIFDMRVLDERKVRELEIKEKLEKEGLYENGRPVEELKNALDIEKEISKEIATNILIEQISRDIFMYYLHKSPDERTRSNLFPSILITPSKAHLKWMKINGIDIPKVLDLKFLLEKELPKYNIPLKDLGGLVLYLVYDWDKVEEFKFKKKNVEELMKKIAPIDSIKDILKDKDVDISKIEKYYKVKKEKTKKFLEALRKL